MKISIENLTALVKTDYLGHARISFGEDGTAAIVSLLDAIKLIYQRCPPECLPGTLTVVRGITASPLSPTISRLGSIERFNDYETLGIKIQKNPPLNYIFIEVFMDGTLGMISLDSDIDLAVIAQSGIVYRYESSTDLIISKNYRDFLPKVSPHLRSNFAVPTFSSLEETFKHYAADLALHSQCRLLKGVWEGGVDGARLVLANKPESLMRDSLVQALQLLHRDASVRPEQNTDETKPVDIRVEWFGTGASALIEIKWIGKSTAISKNPAPQPTYTEYGLARVQEGAKQLSDYMDREKRHSNASAPRGYLVVFDARRKNVKSANDKLSKQDATHYENDKLVLSPDYSKSRADFAPVVRFYMHPRESHFATT